MGCCLKQVGNDNFPTTVIYARDGREFRVGDIVQHFKRVSDGRDMFPGTDMYRYKILCIAVDTDSMQNLVIYQYLYGEKIIWARSVKEFCDGVCKEIYPNCSQDYRFIRIQDGTESDNK